ncbi:MAG: nucleotide sugar dehydrogenase [Actinomycetota bacterium]
MGLGYVGAVSAACLAEDGHTVIGVDPNPTKVDLINDGKSPIVEDRVGELVATHVAGERLSATTDAAAAIAATDLALVCVGTPGQDNGALDLTYLERASTDIGEALVDVDRYYAVVVRSTVLPGTSRNVVIPTIEKHAGKTEGIDFGVVMNPEFLREGSAVFDFYHPPKIVVGGDDDRAAEMLLSLAPEPEPGTEPPPVVRAPFEVAEMVKYVDNSWHALKVAFGNEIGRICGPLGIDSHAVMEVFSMDTKLNISSKYLKPGMAFGGSCLPKDVRAINHHARSHDIELPILGNLNTSNQTHLDAALKMILDTGARDIAILGLSFKAGTDDLREAPMVEVAERLLGKGLRLRIYDRNVSLAKLTGANKQFIGERLPHIGQLLVDDLAEALAGADLVVVGNGDPAFAELASRLPAGTPVVDLVRAVPDPAGIEDYRGFGW